MRRWLPLITIEGGLASVFITVTGGAFLTGLALLLGASEFEIGLLGAIPFLAQTAQMPAAYWVDHTGARKKIVVWCSVVARQMWWLAVPLVLIAGRGSLGAFILLVVLSNLAIMVATPGWMAWMADLIPSRLRGRYFGGRSAVIAVTTMLATIVGSIVLDHFRRGGREDAGYAIIVAVGCVFALAAVILLNRLPDRPAAAIRRLTTWRHMLAPLQSDSFRHLLKVSLGWNFAVGIAAPFFAAHMLTNLRMTFTQIALYTMLASLVAMLLNRPWGVIIDRFGCKPVAAFCAFGLAGVPIFWLFVRFDYLWLLIPEAIYSSALWTGFNLAVFTLPIANSPAERRTVFLAAFSVVTGFGFFAASLLGGLLAEQWRLIHWEIGPQTIINYHLLFALSALLRFLGALFFTTFHEPTEKGLPVMVEFMGTSVLKWLSTGLHIFPRLIKLEKSPRDRGRS